uniref:Zinc-finger domain-containing protein n=1 Tax=Erythrolobus australicus TaxID=1077150 RepID=A0A7S1TKS1_9RHOD|mmetsp:Transcript_2022/g.5384  ORF Transcript_2022/g.5384 Transcript_2022/m.5384 type:complete len:270 (+) Transcript_2022:140-949(+)
METFFELFSSTAVNFPWDELGPAQTAPGGCLRTGSEGCVVGDISTLDPLMCAMLPSSAPCSRYPSEQSKSDGHEECQNSLTQTLHTESDHFMLASRSESESHMSASNSKAGAVSFGAAGADAITDIRSKESASVADQAGNSNRFAAVLASEEGTPTTHVTGSVMKPQQRHRRSRAASTSSKYCHVCGRSGARIRLQVCGRFEVDGGCRKAFCERCRLSFGLDDAASDLAKSCSHCTKRCPPKARCHSYKLINKERYWQGVLKMRAQQDG